MGAAYPYTAVTFALAHHRLTGGGGGDPCCVWIGAVRYRNERVEKATRLHVVRRCFTLLGPQSRFGGQITELFVLPKRDCSSKRVNGNPGTSSAPHPAWFQNYDKEYAC